MRYIIISLGAVFSLTACGSGTDDSQTGNTTEAAPASIEKTDENSGVNDISAAEVAIDEPPSSFAQCKACHSVDNGGKNGIGPNLWGVFETKAGSKTDYKYSDANATSGLVWDEATLDIYLTNPRKTVPGTKMSFAGMPQAEKRKEVIEYLKSLR